MGSEMCIRDRTIPVLITNADQDKVTPPYMGEDLYRAIPHDKKRLYTAKGFGHTEFPQKEREAYQRQIEDFLQANL